MTELTKPKIIPIENRPQKSKLFLKCVVLPIVIFLIVAKIFPLALSPISSLALTYSGL